ncbi:MAG: HdeD family acid-resistance protein [Gemmatimonadaceae bacterium]
MHAPVVEAETLSRNWWAVLFRGLAAILFGIVTFLAPGISLAALVLAFGLYAIVDGIFAIVSAIRHRGAIDRWWVLLLEGVAGLIAGVIALVMPGVTTFVLLYVIAAWAIVTGILEIAAAIRLRRAITGEWLLALSGVASVILGVLLVLYPRAGALAVVLWIGAYALVFGALLVGLAIRLRSWGRTGTPQAAQPLA